MMMPFRQKTFFSVVGFVQKAFAAVCLAATVVVAVIAQSADVRAQGASQEQLFQQIMQQPANHDLTFEYVRVATARGDYEAAIGALERLLFYNPGLTQIKYELGSLYFRLGSFDMARRYFK